METRIRFTSASLWNYAHCFSCHLMCDREAKPLESFLPLLVFETQPSNGEDLAIFCFCFWPTWARVRSIYTFGCCSKCSTAGLTFIFDKEIGKMVLQHVPRVQMNCWGSSSLPYYVIQMPSCLWADFPWIYSLFWEYRGTCLAALIGHKTLKCC